jgi:hypothetical protein
MDPNAVIVWMGWLAFVIAVVVGVVIFMTWGREDNDD